MQDIDRVKFAPHNFSISGLGSSPMLTHVEG